MWYSIRNKLFYFISLLQLTALSQGGTVHGMIKEIPNYVATFSNFDCTPGLYYKVWNQANLSSCNAFFGGAPGTAPAGFADSAGCSNTQYGDFSISPAWDGNDDMIQVKGYILIPETGNYRFRTFSDDGSRLFVNNIQVVNNDGLHGPTTVTSGNFSFTAGVYPYECQFFERGGEDILTVSWLTPSSSNYDIIPNDYFYREPNPECTSLWLTPSKPVTVYNCPKELQDLNMPSGVYLFDPDNDGLNIFKGYYDNSLGGGWLMVLNYVHRGGTDPALNIRTNSLPLLGSSSLGVDESGTQFWGHASNSLLNQFSITEVRFFGVTENHQRVLHFSTSRANVINYIRTGTGSMSGIQTGFTNYAGSGSGTANLPASANSFRSNAGDEALTYTPFYNGNYEWEINRGDDWNMDDRVNDEDENTIHRVWIRTNDCSFTNLLPTDGSNITYWESITKSGRESILSNTAANKPDYINNTTENINYNPVVKFNSTDILSSTSILGIENSELTTFIVSKEITRTNNTLIKFKNSTAGGNRYFSHMPWSDGNIYWDAGTATPPNRIQAAFPNPVNKVSLTTLTNSLSGNTQRIRVDGTSIANDANGHTVTSLDQTHLGENYNGYIGDVIIFDRLINVNEIERTQSYLALKYGITLSHNYYNSDDILIYNVGNGYANDIFGLARDEAHNLYQKKSHTENLNTSDIIFELTTEVSDKQFLITGHNGGALTKRNFVGETNVLNREWFANMTGNVGTINIQVDLASINSNTASAANTVKILIANNPAFNNTYAIEATSVVAGIAYFEGIPLYDKYFTFSAP